MSDDTTLPDPFATLPRVSGQPGYAPPAARSLEAASRVEPPGFALTDGTPLLLTISRKAVFVDLTGSYGGVVTPSHALLLLYLASPRFDSVAWWRPPAPEAQELEGQETGRPRNNRYESLWLAAVTWADTALQPSDSMTPWCWQRGCGWTRMRP